MDGQIIERADIVTAAMAAVTSGDATNPYPPGTAAHAAWLDAVARICQDVQP